MRLRFYAIKHDTLVHIRAPGPARELHFQVERLVYKTDETVVSSIQSTQRQPRTTADWRATTALIPDQPTGLPIDRITNRPDY